MAKNMTNVSNEVNNGPIEVYTAKVLVDKEHLRSAGIQKGTTVEVSVYERGTGDRKRTIYSVKGRHGEAVQIQLNEFEKYNFDHLDIPQKALVEMFNHD